MNALIIIRIQTLSRVYTFHAVGKSFLNSFIVILIGNPIAQCTFYSVLRMGDRFVFIFGAHKRSAFDSSYIFRISASQPAVISDLKVNYEFLKRSVIVILTSFCISVMVRWFLAVA